MSSTFAARRPTTWKLRALCLNAKTVCCLGIFSLSGAAIAQSPRPGEELTITATTKAGETLIRFRYCPPGKIVPGRPAPAKDGASSASNKAKPSELSLFGGAVSMRGFYMSETEVTIDQFHRIAGQDRFAALKKRNEAANKGSPDLLQRMLEGGEYPVFLVSLDDAVAFCRQLDASERASSASTGSSIERRRFRIPSHAEWQYACRAAASDGEIQKYPHFNRWVDSDALNKQDRARCLEEWQAMGRQEADFNGSQFQVAEILDQARSDTNPKPLQVLSAFLKASLKFDRDFSQNRPGILAKVGLSAPNAWQIVDLHENLCEWTLAIGDDAGVQKFWKALTLSDGIRSEEAKRPALFFAGGSFEAIMTGKASGWQRFTIWGGFPLEEKSGTPRPFSVDDEKKEDYSAEHNPGLRVLMERALADDWLLAIRRDTVLSPSAAKKNSKLLDRNRNTVMEIVAASEQPQVLAVLDYYAALTLYGDGKISEAGQEMTKAKVAFSKPAGPKVSLTDFDLSGGSEPPKEQPKAPASDDEKFFRQLQHAIAAESKR